MSLPNALLGVVLTVMGTYYFSADRERIRGFFRRTLPVSWRQRYGFVRKNLLTALFGQVKSQLTVSLIVTAALTLAFVIYGIPYGLAAGVLIGVADALPVIGAGLFLIPWSLLSFIGGSTGMGVFMACAYVGVIVIRQIAEPRIVGRQLGLYPLLTMMAMYAGYRLTGFLVGRRTCLRRAGAAAGAGAPAGDEGGAGSGRGGSIGQSVREPLNSPSTLSSASICT